MNNASNKQKKLFFILQYTDNYFGAGDLLLRILLFNILDFVQDFDFY